MRVSHSLSRPQDEVGANCESPTHSSEGIPVADWSTTYGDPGGCRPTFYALVSIIKSSSTPKRGWFDETPRIIRGVLRIARPSIRSGTFMTSIPAKSILLRYRFFVPSQPESLHERNDLPGRLRRINVGRDPRFGHQVPGFGRKKGASL
jgi:hypothetical protein